MDEEVLRDQIKVGIFQGIQIAVEEMNRIKKGKSKARDAKALSNELLQ